MANKGLGLNYFKSFTKKHGLYCLSKQYFGVHKELIFKCTKREHKRFTKTGKNFQRNPFCPQCEKDRIKERKSRILKDIKLFCQNKGGRCVSDRFHDSKTKLNIWCGKDGHKPWASTWQHLKDRNHWCKLCYQAEKRDESFEYCLKIIKGKGGICLSNSYDRNNCLLVKCHNKLHEPWKTDRNRLHSGRWCPECAGVKTASRSILMKLIKGKGGKVIDLTNPNNREAIILKCRFDHTFPI